MMPTVDLTGYVWRKSSYSGGSGSNGDCVEVACTEPAMVVRDSKATAAGAVNVSSTAWRAFVDSTTPDDS